MRMWNVPTKYMCNRHLLGEHVEMHMFVGTINDHKSLDGYIKNNLIIVPYLKQRHQELVQEMQLRGMNHKSPLPDFSWNGESGNVYILDNIIDLFTRCKECSDRMNNYLGKDAELCVLEKAIKLLDNS